MNIIGNEQTLHNIYSIMTFTIIARPPEIILLCVTDQGIFYCDIDEKALKKEVKGKLLQKDIVGIKNYKILGTFNNQLKIISKNGNQIKILSIF